MDDKLLQPYNPKETEKRIYEVWEKSGFFNPDTLIQKKVIGPEAETFTIVLPPPNVTGILHMGHALGNTIEDILIRWNRMKGKKTLWIPGTDHAGIATQSVVERKIQKEEDKNRHDLGREEFLNRVDMFAKESHDTIISQVKSLGASLDWSREAFTLDEKRSSAVKEAFKRMYDAGLIYRGHRVINWDTKLQTTVSDDEVNHEEGKGKLYTFKYSSDFPISIATTRPETKVGDTAVAVNPDDKRYKEFIGKTYTLDFIGVPLSIRIVGDSAVDPEFGTGALGVTPAHSMTDWEIAGRHDLPVIQVIDEKARMTVPGILHGKKTLEAREHIVQELQKNGLLEKEEEIVQSIAVAERSGAVIEPMPKLQWFVDVNKEFTIGQSHIPTISSGQKVTLKQLMRTAVESQAVKIIPERFEKIYYQWIDNLRDWCISRQLWYGHRIPVWYRGDEIYCGTEAPKESGFEQDPDTLDTWFSSGLWTFSILGWPESDTDLKIYHPTNVLETGADILFFWVARMILMSGFLLGDIPFKTVYIHGIVRDKDGKKMSKSKGNGVNPTEMIEKYGADAVRMSLIVGIGPGNDISLSEEKIKAYKHFANKLWNASRFVLQNTQELDQDTKVVLTEKDRKLLDDLNQLLKEIGNDMESYHFYLAAEKLYHYFWHTFADIIIEESKKRISEGNAEEKKSVQLMLITTLKTTITLLHPFMPFITEEIWNTIQKDGNLLMIEKWPDSISI